MRRFELEWLAHRLFGEDGDILGDERLLVVLAIAAVSISGVFVVSPIVSDLRTPFGISDTQAGNLITVFTAPSVLLVPVVGVLADRFGRRGFVIWGLVLFGLAGAGVGLTTKYHVALLLRWLQGVGFAATLPLTVTLIGDYYRDSREATAQGLRVASIQTVSLVAPTMASLLLLLSWRLPFLFYLNALGVAAWAWRALPEPGVEQESSFRSYMLSLGQSMRQPILAAVLLSFMMRFVLTFGFFAHVSVLLHDSIGATAVQTGLLISAFGLVALLTATQTGRVMAVVDPFLLLFAGFLVAVLSFAVLGFSSALWLTIVGILAFGVSNGITAPIQKSLVTQLVVPARRGGVVSSALFFQSLGQTGGPLVLGFFIARMAPGSSFLLTSMTIGGLGLALTAYAALRRLTVEQFAANEPR